MYKVEYLGHSGFTVETEKYFMIFDYVEKNTDSKLGILDVIEQKKVEIKDINKKVFVFNSHEHFDHYNMRIHKRFSRSDKVFTFVGDIETDIKNTKNMVGQDYYKDEDIEVYSVPATDAGVSFLINIDGLTIYFAGDNIDWDGYMCTHAYIKEIDYLSKITKHVDLAFIPVCNFYGEHNNAIINSAIHTLKVLNVKEMYPMHSPFGKYIYSQFKDKAILSGCKTNIIV